ncbi:glycosyltransferase family 2 protein [Candidatus Pelagibacter ubique]|nr:glycosyltransferase family 2 protein [Candidatus Pelagibacter ubique]
MKKNLSIIMPVFNEVDRLPDTFEKIQKWLEKKPSDIKLDINLIDDGSTDGTIDFLSNFKGFEINIFQKKHSGLMSTIFYGFEKVNSDFYILLAADLPVSLSFLNEFFQHLDDYDIIQGSRYLGHNLKNVTHNRPIGRTILSTVLSTLFQLFFRCKVKDPQIDFKIFNKKVINKIIPYLKLKHDGLKMTEILIRTYAEDMKILEKKTDYSYVNSNRLVPNINIKELHIFLYTAFSCVFSFFKLVLIYRGEFRNKKVKKNPLRFL